MSWPTVEEVSAQPGRLWWIDGQPETLVVDWAAPPSVYWVRKGESVADLPAAMCGGPVLTPTEIAALTEQCDEAQALLSRIREYVYANDMGDGDYLRDMLNGVSDG